MTPSAGRVRSGSCCPASSRASRTDGEICVRGPNVLRSYWERPDATADAFRDGWFLTGDIGEFDEDGYLRIVGRSKDLIITGGYNVYPREIEEILAEHPAVAEAAVAGEPSDEWGETVVAYVVAAEPVTQEDLIAWCAERLAKYKRPAARALPRHLASQRARQGGEERAQTAPLIPTPTLLARVTGQAWPVTETRTLG